jgi:hypothetical protein
MKSLRKAFFNLSILLISSFGTVAQNSEKLTSPADFFGFEPGTDRMLFTYGKMIEYFKVLDAETDKLELLEIGKSPMGNPMYIAFISSANNISNLARLKDINKRLALDPDIPENERSDLIREGRVFYLATLSMHSSEVGPAQSAPQIAYELVSTSDKKISEWMKNVVYMMVPNHNPDGMDMVVNHYNKYKGTKNEGSSLPGIYHKYVGHDNNRDFVSLTQEDTKAIARIYNTEWYPQVMVEKHQMGSTGPRYFVPPNHDPIAENIDAGIWNWSGIFGSNIIKDMTKEGLAGVSQHYLFDDYWPGSTETCIWKNVIGYLTECASAKYATPIFVEPTELKVWGKGLSEYKKSVNMPLLWEGGKWGLEEIVKYEISSTWSGIKTAAANKDEILTFRNDLCRKEISKGQSQPPFYYIIPDDQHDRSEYVNLVNLMIEHGVNTYILQKDIIIDKTIHKKGDVVIPLAQPYRAFIKEVMEKQIYPLRHYTPDGEIIKPYDITSWSLPFHKGVKSHEINSRSEQLESSLTSIQEKYSIGEYVQGSYFASIYNINNNESFKAIFKAAQKGVKIYRLEDSAVNDQINLPKGSFIIYDKIDEIADDLNISPVLIKDKIDLRVKEMTIPRIALVETIFHDMDAGWTRYIFDTYSIPFTSLEPKDLQDTDLNEKFDVIIFPNNSKAILMEGKYKSADGYGISNYPPETAAGMGKDGIQNLMKYLDNGGTIISWGMSTELFTGNLKIERDKENSEEFKLPISDISDELSKNKMYIPGSLIRLKLLRDHPLTYGMPEEVGVFSRGKPVFATSIPSFDMDRRVIGWYPEENILLSGYAENEEKLGKNVGIAWLRKGKGQLVLFGFNPQFRASTESTYKLLFNSILLEKLK